MTDDTTRPADNIEVLADIMRFSKFGALAQLFVIDAVTKAAMKTEALGVDGVAKSFGGNLMCYPASWHGVAVEIREKLDAFYGVAAKEEPCKT